MDASPWYGYIPTKWVGIVGVVCFSVVAIGEAIQASVLKDYLPIIPFIGTIIEIAGWGARVKSSADPLSFNAFVCQVAALIIAPCFYTAQIYVVLQYLVRLYGPDYSILRPKLYAIVFISCDIVALVIQAVGGGIAGSSSTNQHTMDTGGNVMLAGIIIQLIGLSLFCYAGIDFVVRYCKNRPYRTSYAYGVVLNPDLQPPYSSKRFLSIGLLVAATISIFIRSIYRVVELAYGWSGPVITREVYFDVFDLIPMVVTSALLLGVMWPVTEVKQLPVDVQHITVEDDNFTKVNTLTTDMSPAVSYDVTENSLMGDSSYDHDKKNSILSSVKV
ncbi:hypothetical protein SJAG_02581 [Schizosaccharomyces japonicus yFS275]|uniref:Sphingoid long-chain base transporter RSB1 n=1 Tax=Schizosaccharomyces japonicus (strain yFS275 / FY16936) TaxID=402676 RepID=B6K0M3_SCHJY|nr:hypothetical protein SJAG_02581 [Schizosaccharomyces japonicus yFS275]EEB07494.1 hypothetical protein SJAG_02581 [Schizosaccharomyces japonicus yFS275]